MDVVARLHRAIEEVDGIRQILFELVQTAVAQLHDVEDWNPRDEQSDQQTEQWLIETEQADAEVGNAQQHHAK